MLSLIQTSQCQKLNLCIPIFITVVYRPAPAQFLLAHRILLSQAFVRIFPLLGTWPFIYMCIVAVYPSFDLYPLPPFHNDGLDSNSDSSALSPNCPVGLLQPSSPFIHHGYAVKFFLIFIFYLIQRLLSFFACQGKLYTNPET